MFRRSNYVTLKCPTHSRLVQYVCVENHLCNPEKNRTLCEECLQAHQQSGNMNDLEAIEDFLSGDFIYSDMQKTIEALEDRLSESHYQKVQRTVEDNFEKLKEYFIKQIEEAKKGVLDELKAKRFERHFVLSSWKRLQEDLENKLDVLTEQAEMERKDLEEYIELFHQFKMKSRTEQTVSKLEDEFEKKLLIEDKTVQGLKSSLADNLKGLKKNIWEDTPNLVRAPVLENPKLELCEVVQTGMKGFRVNGIKYFKEIDKIFLYDRDFKLMSYDLLSKQMKDIDTIPNCNALEYIPKLNRVLLGGKGTIHIKNLGPVIMEVEQQEAKVCRDLITCLKYLPEQGLVLCSGLFLNIYCLSPEENFKVVDTINTTQQYCSSMYYLRGKGLLAGGLENGWINIYNLRDKSIRETLKGHVKRVLALDYNFTKDILVSGSKDGSIRVWMYRQDRFHCNMIIERDMTMGVTSLQFISNNIVMSLQKDLYIRFWDALTGKEVGKDQVFKDEGFTAQYVEERGLVIAGEFGEGKVYMMRLV